MNVKPLADRVLVEPALAETTTASGIIIPDNAQEKPPLEFSKSDKEMYNSGSEEMFSDDEIMKEILRYVNEP